MNALDSPLEALAVDYLSFGLLTVVNNVWTWVAVVTAAVSVWKFRASSSPCVKFPDEAELIQSVSSSPEAETVKEAARPSTAAVPLPCVFNGEGRTSGKFTFYYDRTQKEEEDRFDDGNGEDGNVGGEKQWFGEGWEVMMRMRMHGDDHMGFYRYQDLTMLDGSVVRLWDGCRRRYGSSSGAPFIRCGGGEGSCGNTIMW